MRLLLIVFVFCSLRSAKAEDLWPDQTFLNTTYEYAVQGDPASQLLMGLFYETGWGVPQNLEEAILWYSYAIESGNELALRRMGILTFFGLGTPKDEELGILMTLLGPHDDLFPNFSAEQRAKVEELRKMWKRMQSEHHPESFIVQTRNSHSRKKDHRNRRQIPIMLASDRWDPMEANGRFYGPGTGDWNTGISYSEYERFQKDCENLTGKINAFRDWADERKAKDLRAQIECLQVKGNKLKSTAFNELVSAVGNAMAAGLFVIDVPPIAIFEGIQAVGGFKEAADLYIEAINAEKDAQKLLSIERSLERARLFGGRE